MKLKVHLLILSLFIKCTTGYAIKITSVGLDFSPSLTKPIDVDEASFAFAYGGGLTTTLRLSDKMFLKTGIGYKNKIVLFEDMLDSRSMVDENGNVNPDNFRYFDANIKRNYVSIPVIFNYRLSKSDDKKTTFYLSAGLEMNYNYKTKIVIGYYDGDQEYTDSPNKSYSAGAAVGMGMQYKISKRIGLTLEPQYAYDFYEHNNDLKFYNWKLNVGLHYNL